MEREKIKRKKELEALESMSIFPSFLDSTENQMRSIQEDFPQEESSTHRSTYPKHKKKKKTKPDNLNENSSFLFDQVSLYYTVLLKIQSASNIPRFFPGILVWPTQCILFLSLAVQSVLVQPTSATYILSVWLDREDQTLITHCQNLSLI